MLKGLALTPPAIGRISIGKVIERNGKRLPEKDDEFTITSQVQGKEGWITHPLDAALRQSQQKAPATTSGAAAGPESTARDSKLRTIPVRLMFNDPDLNLRSSYCLFDRQSGRPICVGNGETCKRASISGIQSLDCPSPEACGFNAHGYCKPYGRMNVLIVVEPENSVEPSAASKPPASDHDELGSFVFRTTGFNSIRTLASRLSYFSAASGGLLSCLPLELRLRGKSTSQSHRAPIYYVDLTVRTGFNLNQAISRAREVSLERQGAGLDQEALDSAARQGFALGAFEESAEEGVAVVEEFFHEQASDAGSGQTDAIPSGGPGKVAKRSKPPALADKIASKAALLQPVETGP